MKKSVLSILAMCLMSLFVMLPVQNGLYALNDLMIGGIIDVYNGDFIGWAKILVSGPIALSQLWLIVTMAEIFVRLDDWRTGE